MRYTLLIVFLLVFGWVSTASAQATPQDQKAARKLAKQAKKLARKGDWGEAAKLYTRAEELHQHWEYPVALATGHKDNGLLPLAWRAIGRAQQYGIPERKQDKVVQLLILIETELLSNHAFIELTNVPENADVRLNGNQWLPPYFQWVSRNFSRLEIEHANYLKRVDNWHHVKGKRHSRAVEMVPKSTFGRFKVSGTPAGAAILIDGNHVGRLPNYTSELVKPGKYPIKVESGKDWLAYEGFVEVTAGGEATVKVALEPSASEFERLLATKKFWGWTMTGLGGAMTVTGAVLLGVGASKRDEMIALNDTHDGGYQDYVSQYDALESSRGALVTSGHVLLWVGLAAAATGATLLILDSGESNDSSDSGTGGRAETGWRLEVVPVGAGAGARVTF